MFLVNSRHRHFSAALPGSLLFNNSPKRAPLLPKLRGYFAEFLDQSSLERLGIFYPPTCVGFRYGPHELYLEAFLGSLDSTAYGHTASLSLLGFAFTDLPVNAAYQLTPAIPTAGRPILLRPSIARSRGYENINSFSISYAFRPRLRVRLTLGRLPLPRKPWVYDERVFHPF